MNIATGWKSLEDGIRRLGGHFVTDGHPYFELLLGLCGAIQLLINRWYGIVEEDKRG